MPSFDVVSEVNMHELANALDQANREVDNRYDFKGTDSKFVHTEDLITLESDGEFQLEQMLDILYKKLAKRGIELGSLDVGDPQASGKRTTQKIKLHQGISQDLARKIIKTIKDSKMKVQTAIQGDQVRVTGKKRDDLQSVISLLGEAKLEQPLQYENFRD